MIVRIQQAVGTDAILVRTVPDNALSVDHVAIMTYDGSGNGSGVGWFVDSTTQPTLNITNENLVSSTLGNADAYIASRNGTTFLSGEIAEFAVHGVEYIAAEVSDLMDYAGDRYGITIT